MAKKTVLDFSEITDRIAADDVAYLIRGTGAGRDKKITASKFMTETLVQNTTGSIDLSIYATDLVIISTPTADITLTFSNALPAGRTLTIINKNTAGYKIGVAGSLSVADIYGNAQLIFDASSYSIVDNRKYTIATSSPLTFDCFNYKDDHTIIVTSGGIFTIHLNNYLPPGKVLTVVNLQNASTAIDGTWTSRNCWPYETIKLISTGAAWQLIQTQKTNIVGDTTDRVLLNTDNIDILYMTTSTSMKTVTLPNKSSNIGRVITIKKFDSGSGYVKIVPFSGSDRIDGQAEIYLYEQYDSVTMYTNGSDWFIISQVKKEYPADNLLINGDMEIAQRGASGSALFTSTSNTPNNDANYLIDRFQHYSDGNNITNISQDSDAPTGFKKSMKAVVVTGNKKWAYSQKIESELAIPMRGQKCALSFWAKTTTAKVINNLRAAVIAWDGTADTITNDIISAWNGSGSDLTFVANCTVENTPGNLALTTSWQQFKIENILLDTTNFNNLIVVIWVDDVDASVNDELFVDGVNLNRGPYCLPFKHESKAKVLADCQRFCEKSYDLSVVPGTASTNGVCWGVLPDNASYPSGGVRYSVLKFKVPTVYFYSPVSGLVAKTRDWATTADYDITIAYPGKAGFQVDTPGISTSNAHAFHYIADAEL